MDECERRFEDYIVTVIENNINKDLILWSFHKNEHWVLITISPKDDDIYYLDSLLSAKRDLEDVKRLIKRSFQVLANRELIDSKIQPTHHLKYKCRRQPSGMGLCGFYAAYHMNFRINRAYDPEKVARAPRIEAKALNHSTLVAIIDQIASFLRKDVFQSGGECFDPTSIL